MTPIKSLLSFVQAVLLPAVICTSASTEFSRGEELTTALQTLNQADASGASQANARQAWQLVTSHASADSLPDILAAMKNAGPLADNWLRSAVDAIAEREFEKTASLPSESLERFIQDKDQSPRARRVAYEWLVKSDSSASTRLLPLMLDDESLELRYDAIARLLDDAKAAEDTSARIELYQRALRSARDKGQLRTCAEALKELGEPPNMAKQLGFLTEWKVIGPFDNADREGFNTIHFPAGDVDLSAEYSGKHDKVRWKDAVAEQEKLDDLGKVDFNAALVEEKSVLAYAHATFVANREMEVECRYETKEATKLWVNGEELAVNNIYHSGSGFDQYIVPCKLRQGENEILIKVCQNEQTQPWTKPWDFRLRITDSLGGAIQPAE